MQQPKFNPAIDMDRLMTELSAGPKPPEVVQFAPLVDRLPEVGSKQIRDAFEVAAKVTEDAAQKLLQQIEEVMAVTKLTADATRSVGNSQAEIVEKSSGLMRDFVHQMREHHQKLDAFKGAAQ